MTTQQVLKLKPAALILSIVGRSPTIVVTPKGRWPLGVGAHTPLLVLGLRPNTRVR